MKTRNYVLYAGALAVLVVGALWARVPVGTLVLFGLLLVCPFMMIFMMRGGAGGADHGHHITGRDFVGRDVADRPSPPEQTIPREKEGLLP